MAKATIGPDVILTLMNAVNEMEKDMGTLTQNFLASAKLAKKTSDNMGKIARTLRRVVDAVEDHEKRLSALEAAQ